MTIATVDEEIAFGLQTVAESVGHALPLPISIQLLHCDRIGIDSSVDILADALEGIVMTVSF